MAEAAAAEAAAQQVEALQQRIAKLEAQKAGLAEALQGGQTEIAALQVCLWPPSCWLCRPLTAPPHAVQTTRELRIRTDTARTAESNVWLEHRTPLLPVLSVSSISIPEISSRAVADAALVARRFWRLIRVGGVCTA